MILSYVVSQLPGAVVGFVAGAFCPSILRKIKALFVKESTALKASAKAEAAKIKSKL